MTDVDDRLRAAFDDLNHRYGGSSPLPDWLLATAARRRRAQRLSVLGVLVVVTVAIVAAVTVTMLTESSGPARQRLITSPSQSPTVSAPGGRRVLLAQSGVRLTRPVTIEGGTLTLTPPASDSNPVFPRFEAAQDARRAVAAEGGWVRSIGPTFADVSISRELTGDLPSYVSRPAWLTVFTPTPDVGCPVLAHSTGAGIPTAIRVIVVDATTGGDAEIFTSAGTGLCGARIARPTVQLAAALVSIPWTMLGQRPDPSQPGYVDWHISYRTTTCATEVDSPSLSYTNGRVPVLQVTVQVPFDLPVSCLAKVHTTWFGPESQPAVDVQHASTGPTSD